MRYELLVKPRRRISPPSDYSTRVLVSGISRGVDSPGGTKFGLWQDERVGLEERNRLERLCIHGPLPLRHYYYLAYPEHMRGQLAIVEGKDDKDDAPWCAALLALHQ